MLRKGRSRGDERVGPGWVWLRGVSASGCRKWRELSRFSGLRDALKKLIKVHIAKTFRTKLMQGMCS